MSAPRGIRNRNPGNIVVAGWTQRQAGYTGPEPEGRFATFATMADGLAALLRLLKVYRDEHNLTTVRGIINRWAPPSENETTAYVAAVSSYMHVQPDDELADMADTYFSLAHAIAMHENGREAASHAISTADWQSALAAVFDQQAQPPTVAVAGQGETPPAPAPAPPPGPEFEFGRGEGGFPSFPFPQTPFTERKAMLPQVAIALGSKLLELLPMFGSGSAVSNRNITVTQEIAGQLLKTAREVVPSAVNEQEMVEKILQSPELQMRFKAQAATKWDDLAPFFKFEEESRKEARTFAEQMTGSGPLWRAAGFGAALLVLALGVVYGGGWILAKILFEDGTDTQTRGMIIGAIIAFITQILSYFFGSSASSRGKDQALADAAKR